jgi:hypothetical protein
LLRTPVAVFTLWSHECVLKDDAKVLKSGKAYCEDLLDTLVKDIEDSVSEDATPSARLPK